MSLYRFYMSRYTTCTYLFSIRGSPASAQTYRNGLTHEGNPVLTRYSLATLRPSAAFLYNSVNQEILSPTENYRKNFDRQNLVAHSGR